MEFIIEEPDKKIGQEIKANWDRLANRWMVWGSLRDFSQGSGQSLGRQRLILRKKQ